MHNVDSVVQMLRGFCDANGWLTHYRNDLEVHDRRTFERLPGWSDFVWVVGKTYTHLFPIGLHQQLLSEALDTIAVRSKEAHGIYLLDLRKAPGVGRNRAMEEIDAKTAALHLKQVKCFQWSGQRILDPQGRECGSLVMDMSFHHLSSVWTGEYSVHDLDPAFREEWALQFALACMSEAKGLWVRVVPKPSMKAAA